MGLKMAETQRRSHSINTEHLVAICIEGQKPQAQTMGNQSGARKAALAPGDVYVPYANWLRLKRGNVHLSLNICTLAEAGPDKLGRDIPRDVLTLVAV